MKVTDKMRQRFRDLFWQQRELKNPDALGSAFELALAEVPEPQPAVEYGKDRFGWFQIGVDGCRHDWDAPEERIAELETENEALKRDLDSCEHEIECLRSDLADARGDD